MEIFNEFPHSFSFKTYVLFYSKNFSPENPSFLVQFNGTTVTVIFQCFFFFLHKTEFFAKIGKTIGKAIPFVKMLDVFICSIHLEYLFLQQKLVIAQQNKLVTTKQ